MNKMKDIMEGYIDLHLHAGPSVAAREVDAGDMALEDAAEYGYKAFVVKDHLFPTMMSAKLVEKHLCKDGLKVFGGIALNNSTGLFNLKAVDTAYEMGAKFIYMPTISAARHIEAHSGGGHFAGAGKAAVDEVPVTYVDNQGELIDEAKAIIDYVAEREDLILATGHGSLAEVDAVVKYAKQKAVKRIYVNHPYYIVDADIDKIKEWVELGAFIELNATLIVPESTIFATEFDVIREIMDNISAEHLVLVSDLGQKGNIRPALGVYRLIEMLMDNAGVSREQIDIMCKKNPAYLLGID